MNKKSSPLKNSPPVDFSWAGDTALTPPTRGGSTALHHTPASQTSPISDLKPMLEELLKTTIVAAKASAGIIRIIPPHSQALQLICSTGLPVEQAKTEIPLPCENCRITITGSGIYSADALSCDSKPDCRYTDCRFRSIIVTPLENDNGTKNSAGMLTLLFNSPPQTVKHTAKIVQSCARLINAIVEHNKTNRDAKRTDLMAERHAIANEIHDSLAQTLVYTRMRTSSLLDSIRTGNELMSAKYARDIDEALEISQKTVRELITDFRCAMDPSGLLHALQTLTEQFCLRNDIELEYINRVTHLELPLEHEIQVLHIVQEALANIATHSGATHARLIVDYVDHYYLFTIKDNGSGGCTFTPVEGHYGMMIMRERAQRISGEIKVESTKGHGTRVQLFFPEPGTDWRTVNE